VITQGSVLARGRAGCLPDAKAFTDTIVMLLPVMSRLLIRTITEKSGPSKATTVGIQE
jgi:hypothetical protein